VAAPLQPRDDSNRRIHVVELTPAGEAGFLRLRDAAIAFDPPLRRGIGADEITAVEAVLDRLVVNIGANDAPSAPWGRARGRQNVTGLE
jgi:MarR family transcriptional regulator, transcriptional regulator for hemolysin